jgi:HEAT repeat protein
MSHSSDEVLDFDQLMQQLQHSHWSVRSQAATILGQQKECRAVDALIDLLKDHEHIFGAAQCAA